MSVIRTADSPRTKATAAKVAGMLSDGKWHRVTASVYGRADSGGNPACGGSLKGATWFAELDSGQALGGLPCGTKIDVKGPSGRILTMPKRDRNSTNNLPGLQGTRRAIDVWKENGAPGVLGISGLAVVEVRLSTGDAGGSFGDDSLTETISHRFEFTRGEHGGKRENSWDAMGRLAEEVAWSRWAAGNTLLYVSQDELIAGPPGVELDGREPWLLDEPAWKWSPHRPIEELNFHVTGERWGIMPGGVVLVSTGRPFDGRWLVARAEGDSLTDPIVAVTLKRPTQKKPEPAAETSQRSVPTDSGAGGPLKLEGTPKEIIDRYILPIGRKHGLQAGGGGGELTPANVTRANASHGPTVSGNRSDHQGPPGQAWAADMGDWSHPLSAKLDACAVDCAQLLGFPTAKGLQSKHDHGYKIQLIYGANYAGAGDHTDHVHVGFHKE